MSGHTTFKKLSAPIHQDPVRHARVRTMRQALLDAEALTSLREARVGSQQTVAQKINVSQSRISQIERGDDLYLSTLRGYIEAIGGHLEITAVFPDDERVTLTPSTAPRNA